MTRVPQCEFQLDNLWPDDQRALWPLPSSRRIFSTGQTLQQSAQALGQPRLDDIAEFFADFSADPLESSDFRPCIFYPFLQT